MGMMSKRRQMNNFGNDMDDNFSGENSKIRESSQQQHMMMSMPPPYKNPIQKDMSG